jgi:hypothetical protein
VRAAFLHRQRDRSRSSPAVLHRDKHGYRVSKALRESWSLRGTTCSPIRRSLISISSAADTCSCISSDCTTHGDAVLAQALDDDGYLIPAPVETPTDAAGRFENVSRPCGVPPHRTLGSHRMAQPAPSTVGRAAEALHPRPCTATIAR